jgi:hypothetical protein
VEELEEPVFLGRDRSVSDFLQRFGMGAFPLLVYGVVGAVEQNVLAPFQFQIPIGFGFTLATPLSPPMIKYTIGVPGLSQDLQSLPHLRGQEFGPTVFGFTMRTHTTGLIDYGVRHAIPGSVSAEELIHPGRVSRILSETRMEDSSMPEPGDAMVRYNGSLYPQNEPGNWGPSGPEIAGTSFGLSTPGKPDVSGPVGRAITMLDSSSSRGLSMGGSRMSGALAVRGGRRRRRGRGRVGYRTTGDWVTSSVSTDNTGTAATVSSWGGAITSIAAGSGLSLQLMSFPTTNVASPPSIGEVIVNMIVGSIFFSSPSAAGVYVVGIGIYVSQYNTTATKWAVRTPTLSTDAARDDYLFLRCIEIVLTVSTTLTTEQVIEVAVGLPGPVQLGNGEALHLTVNNDTLSAGSLSMVPFVRSHISRAY